MFFIGELAVEKGFVGLEGHGRAPLLSVSLVVAGPETNVVLAPAPTSWPQPDLPTRRTADGHGQRGQGGSRLHLVVPGPR